ncbi:MAG: CDP-diacylglycerol--serine O-phosphatidyltransferase [Deltaproteobacteria bacterium]|nr:CDP-diacylglycerol--serine O-phosphatidyltransferase [Deltaproteobacteria bacterium]
MKSRARRGVFLLPSLLTAAALFSGFYSIIFTLNSLLFGRDNFHTAVVAIILATFFDSMDGRVARLMKAESEFGSHFDSIADMVSFGVAPAVLVYAWALIHLGRMGWLGAFLFLACAAIRLARFNVISSQGMSKKYFKGLSSPVAAGGLALCLMMLDSWLDSSVFSWAILGITICLSLLMISNVRFRSFKDLDLKKYRVQSLMIGMLLIVLIFSFHEVALFFIFLIYLASGLIEELILFRRRRKSDPSVPFLPFGDKEEDTDL